LIISLKKQTAILFSIIFSIVPFIFTSSVYAQTDDETASVYFDTEDSFPYIYLSDNLLSISSSSLGKSNSSLKISGRHKDTDIESSSVVFFNSSDFGLSSFRNCKISAYILANQTMPDNAVNIKLYSDGAELKASSVVPTDSWAKYSIDIGECDNNIAGIYIKFNEPYEGAICSIDNFTVIKPDGTIASLNNINDEVITKETPSFLFLGVIALIIVLVICGIAHLIKEAFFKYR